MKTQIQKAFGLIIIFIMISQCRLVVAGTFGNIINASSSPEQIGTFNVHDLPKELAANIDTYLPAIREAILSDDVQSGRKALILNVVGHTLLNKANPIEACDLLDVMAEAYLNVAEVREECFYFLHKTRNGVLPEWMEASIVHRIRTNAFDKYDLMLLGAFTTQVSLSVLQESMNQLDAKDGIYASAALTRRTGNDEYASALYDRFHDITRNEWTYNPVLSGDEPSAELNDMIWLLSYIGTPLSLFTMYDNLITSPIARPKKTARLHRMPQSRGKTHLVWMLNSFGKTAMASEIHKQRQGELMLWWEQNREAVREILNTKDDFPHYVAFRWGK